MSERNQKNKRIRLILTGGTISGFVAKDLELEDAKKPQPDDFLSVLDTALKIIKRNWDIDISIDILELFTLDSSNFLPEHWTKLAESIAKDYDSFDGFIVLHGTNTMGYTTAALSFALENLDKPVIFTGAQVPLGYLGSDASTNLVNALRLAVWKYHPIKGVLAVFGSKIIAGTRVKKGSDFDYDPFASFQTGAIGLIGRTIKIDEPALNKHLSFLTKNRPAAVDARTLHVQKEFDAAQIASITEFPGMMPTMLSDLVDKLGIKAFIFRAFGAGDPNERLLPAFKYLQEKKVPIVVTTQAASGVASMAVNEPGTKLREQGLAIPAHDMSMESMVTKLSWLLAQKHSYESIATKMLENLHGEINIQHELK